MTTNTEESARAGSDAERAENWQWQPQIFFIFRVLDRGVEMQITGVISQVGFRTKQFETQCGCEWQQNYDQKPRSIHMARASGPLMQMMMVPFNSGGRGSSRRGRGMGGQNGPQADTDVQ